MAIRKKSDVRLSRLTQYDTRYAVPRIYITANMPCQGKTSVINEINSRTFSDNLGRPLKITDVTIEKTRIKTPGYKDFWIGSQHYMGDPIGQVYLAQLPLLIQDFTSLMFPENSNLINNTKIRALAKLDRTEVGGGENAASIRETLRMLKAPLSSVAKLGREMLEQSKRKTQSTRDSVKYYQRLGSAVSDQWLQYRYGIMPLIYDAQGLVNIADESLWRWQNQIKTVRATSYLKQTGKKTDVSYPGYVTTAKTEGIANQVDKVTVIVYYCDKLFMKDAIALEQVGLSPLQWPSLAYELTPFSFVADWGINIGGWLKAIQPHPTMDVKGLTVSYKRTDDRILNTVLSNWSSVATVNFPWTYHRESIRRYLDPTAPTFPGLTSGALSLKRKIDGIALAWSNWPKLFSLFKTKKKH